MNAFNAPVRTMTKGQLQAAVTILRRRTDSYRQGLIKLCNAPGLTPVLRNQARALLRANE